uniref:Uncharacterized protein n=1 Tax=Octopus bimaculoides TaxID=37653 RepID=A0A0L8FZ20_OCTBM
MVVTIILIKPLSFVHARTNTRLHSSASENNALFKNVCNCSLIKKSLFKIQLTT